MYFFHGTMRIDFLSKTQRDLRLRGLDHSFLLIKLLSRNLLTYLTNGYTQPLRVLFILSAKKWMDIDYIRSVLLLYCKITYAFKFV